MKIFDLLTKPLDFITKYLKALIFIVIVVFLFLPDSKEPISEANVARINLYGAILQSDSFLEELEKLERNPNIKGILLVIDSPGGAIAPSVEISEAIKRVNLKTPIIAYTQGAMASGSYLAGVWADSIVANRGALLGSIGVIINGADISELANKLGIKTQTLKAGIYKEAGTFMRAWNSDEEEMLKDLVEEQYKMFVNEVATARKINPKDEDKFAQGRILSAKTALELGLIDEIGSIYEAQNLLFKKAEIKNPKWQEKDKIEMYLEKIFGENLALGVQNGIALALEQLSRLSLKGE